MKNCGKFIRRKSIRTFVSFFFTVHERSCVKVTRENNSKNFAIARPFIRFLFFSGIFFRFDVSSSKANFRWFFNMNFRSGNRQLALLITGDHFSQDHRLLSTFFYHIMLYSSTIIAGVEQSFWQFRNNADAAQFLCSHGAYRFIMKAAIVSGLGKNFEMFRKNIARPVLSLPEKQFEKLFIGRSFKNFQHQFN